MNIQKIAQEIKHLDWLKYYAKQAYFETHNKKYYKEICKLGDKIQKKQELYKSITGNYLDMKG